MKNYSYEVKINGQPVSREAVMEEELRRSRLALRVIKDALGAEGMRRLLGKAADEETEREMQTLFAESDDDEIVKAVTEMEVKGISAEEFLGWWFKAAGTDPDGMNAAHPEHYMGYALPDGSGQEVLEVNGGTDMPLHFEVHFHQTPEGAPEKPVYPIAAYATATTSDGREMGKGVMHQFATTEDGFKAMFCNYYSKNISDEAVHKQQMHLAVEWSNWIEKALDALGKKEG